GRGACPGHAGADHAPAARCGRGARVGPGDPVPRPRAPRVPPPRQRRAEAPAPARRGRRVDAAEGGVMLTTRDVTIETMPTGQPGEHSMRVDVHLTRWTRLRMTWDIWW